jgi:hypothetical protein
MLIPKQKKKVKIDNPLRPKIGLPREHTICKISWGDYWIEPDEVVQRLKVDCDHNDEFVAVLEAEIPKDDRYRCHDHEVYLIDPKWKSFIVEKAQEYFDQVDKELRKW